MLRWGVAERKAQPPVPLPISSHDQISVFRLTPAGAIVSDLVLPGGTGGGDQKALRHRLLLVSPDGSPQVRMLEDRLVGAKLTTSADGRRLAAIVERDKVTLFDIWDTTTGQFVKRIKDVGSAEVIGALAFDPTGSVLYDTWLNTALPTGTTLKEIDSNLQETSTLPVTRWSLTGSRQAGDLRAPLAWQTLLPLGGDAIALISGDQIGLLLPSPRQTAFSQLAAMAEKAKNQATAGSTGDTKQELTHLCRLYGNTPQSDSITKLIPAGAHKGKLC